MTADASETIQRQIIAKLLATAAVIAKVNQRIYDRVPAGTQAPYISVGPSQTLQDDAECIDGYEVFQQIDVWSQAPGFIEAKQIAGEVRKALHDVDLDLDGYALVEIRHQVTRLIRDSDGLTSHAAMDFRALVETDE